MNLTTIHFKLKAIDSLDLPYYKGSTFRGAFGHALKQSVCVMRNTECAVCALKAQCAYVYLFETRNDRGEAVAHPYIIEPPSNMKSRLLPGETFELRMVLIGRAIEYVPYVIHSLKQMGKRGVGRRQGRFSLEEAGLVAGGQRQQVYDALTDKIQKGHVLLNLNRLPLIETETVTLDFLTVTGLKHQGRLVAVPDFETIVRAIFRRVKALNVYHGQAGEAPEFPDFDGSVQTEENRLKKDWWQRYSSRQHTKIKFDGFVGRIRFAGNITPYTRLLQMGRLLHLGRGTVYGMGRYELEINHKL